jgi:dephospho-CoA kinase
MFIALTGLHRVGKSYFIKNIPVKFGFKVVDKKELLERICKSELGVNNWQEWYKEAFNNNPEMIVEKMLSYLSQEEDIILDSVHSNIEWSIIKKYIPNARLVYITALEEDRKERWEKKEISDLKIKDDQRLGFWHSFSEDISCLAADASWSINGSGSMELMEKSFFELIQKLNELEDKKNKVKKLIK